jgi:hypothetical protein
MVSLLLLLLLLLFEAGLDQGDGGSDVKGKYVRSREGVGSEMEHGKESSSCHA